jgi:hypothetical protein
MDAKTIIEEANCVYVGSVKRSGTTVHRFHATYAGAKLLSIYEGALALEGPEAITKLITLFGTRARE